MRAVASLVVAFALLLNSGCGIIEKEKTNRGGYLDYVIDRHWMKADSKGMRALRAFAIQVSLARIASVSAKNESDRQLLAIRIGALTKRFQPVYACAFNRNPLGVAGGENDPCFYYDSAMVDYSTGLFDLAMIALPIEEAKNLVTSLAGSTVNPINILDLLESLISVARDAIKYGRVVGALYRDTIELEVQLWLATPAIDDRPPSVRVTEADVAALREIYARRNDDMPAWLAAIAALRGQGLEPVAQERFFVELAGLMKYLCDLITRDPSANRSCKEGLPTTLRPPSPVLSAAAPLGSVFTRPSQVRPGRGPGAADALPKQGGLAKQKDTPPPSSGTGTGQVQPPPAQIDPGAAAAEMDRFIQPDGPGTPFNTANRATLQAHLDSLPFSGSRRPNLLEVLRSNQQIPLRLELYKRFKGL